MPRRVAIAVVVGLALAAALGGWLVSGRPPNGERTGPAWEVAGLLGASEPGGERFRQVTAVAPLRFPRDHGAHPGYRHEWWYLTGNLDGADGRRFGFQLTLFRFGLRPDPPPADASAWRTRDLYMAHFALSDIDGGRFDAWERFARPALGLAGAESAPFRAWLETWRIASTADRFLPLRVRVAADGRELDLELGAGREHPIVLQGDRGYSRKGAAAGNATRYYSLPRLAAAGRLRTPDGEVRVRGLAWLDREWGSSALADGVVGWDWFALHLDDGRDLMLYRLRRADGRVDPFSAGTLVAADGSVARLAASDFAVTPRGAWRAPDGLRYPSGWRVEVPGHALALTVEPLLRDQELRLSVRYWEGAVRVAGTVDGRGYVELTGYGGAGQGRGGG